MSDNEEDIQDPVDMNDTKENNNQEKGITELDIAFVLDCTGSMNPYIKSAQDNIINIANQISEEEGCDTRFALVAFRDIPPQELSFVTDIVPFTSVPLLIQLKLNKLEAKGGGDASEALTTALHKTRYELSWRKDSIKIIIVIGDAAPHGLETGGYEDGFPNGDIIVDNNNNNSNKYYNIIDILKSIRNDLNGNIYSVGCEPTLSCSFDFARDFYEYMSDYTHGKYLPLSNATLLPNVVIGCIKEQIMSYELMTKLENEMNKIRNEYGDNIDDNKINELITDKWKENGIKTKTVSIGTLYRIERQRDNIDLLMNDQIVKSLNDFKKHCKILPRPKRSDFRHLNIDKRRRSRSRSRSREKKKKHKKRYCESDNESDSESENEWYDRDRDTDTDRDRDRDRSRSRSRSKSRSRSRSPQRVYVKSKPLSNNDVGRITSQWKSRNKTKKKK